MLYHYLDEIKNDFKTLENVIKTSENNEVVLMLIEAYIKKWEKHSNHELDEIANEMAHDESDSELHHYFTA